MFTKDVSRAGEHNGGGLMTVSHVSSRQRILYAHENLHVGIGSG